MSVKNFKFVSPGVFINEIDNSFIPRQPDAIGPVVIGRAARGPAMQPVKIESYSEFVEVFGDTVAGNGGGDVYRDGNRQSPMYGTFAAKAFLNANVAPLTYVRVLGEQSPNQDGTLDAQAGWRTNNYNSSVISTAGGAYGLFLVASGSGRDCGTARLAATFYMNDGYMRLSGAIRGGGGTGGTVQAPTTGALNAVIGNDSSNLFTIIATDAAGTEEKVTFGFDDNSANFVRKRFNTNPQLVSGAFFYASASAKTYWLGESYEQSLRDNSLTGDAQGIIVPICSGSSAGTGPQNMLGQASRDGRTGWFIGQDLGSAASFLAFNQQKLFRLIGRGYGEWLEKNVKISVANVRQSMTTQTDYGSFSLIMRHLNDTDNAIQVVERFDNLTLDPSSPNYIGRRIGTQYTQWDTQTKSLKTYGDYPNQSKFFYVEMNPDAAVGGTDATLLPFGYFGPPNFETISGAFGGATAAGVTWTNKFVSGGVAHDAHNFVSGSGGHLAACLTASFSFPTDRLVLSASSAGLADPTNAFFGFDNRRGTRTSPSTQADRSVASLHRLLYSGFSGGGGAGTAQGVNDYGYVFSLDDVVSKNATEFYYNSGSRAGERSYSSGSYTDLLDAGYTRFTAPVWGGFDGFNIMKPDPLYNLGMTEGTSTENNSYSYYSWRRAIDTVADPEFIDMNLLAAPGLTLESLTSHMVNTCEDRADSLALIDLPNVYVPRAERYYSSQANRVATNPTQAATALRNRRIDSSYGCTFYPWVQARDENSGQLLWVPPSVAMMGVLASSERSSDLWFAPAGFNRGGLTEGAAGLPITGVSERLTSRQRDRLYEANINPIASFPSSGIVVFGQKTLQERQSALDRINVRRLVIYLKKQISILSTQVLFEQNVPETWARFKGLVEPLLQNVRAGYGITDYRLVLDESTTTPDLIDQNIMYAKIMVKPARAIEYIAIDFVIMSSGASFDD